ncbi:LacI family DNA-binding transcriptional regulator [Nonomuraea sp. NPDC004580]|uniref:LacI family DNA-binding transcriptional regulator n=1 Tax=Nonomuraea sp. NPDC004580 TaxID=3154552 RepID=UPI0033A284BF
MHADEPVTILTVAREAGVSKTTASDALRGSGRVSERTREQVARVAERLGYVPNGSARHLRKASTGTIGLHVPEVLTRSSYYMSFVFGVVEQAARHDYDVTLITSGQRRARPPRVDGLVLGDPLSGDPVVESLMATGLPTVSCERFPGDRQPDGVVWSEHAVMLGRLLDHVRDAGSTRPGLVVAGDESDWAASLHRGYLAWCTAKRVEPLVRRVSFDANGDEVRAAARALLATPMDALICAPAGAATEVAPLLHASGTGVLLASCVDSAATRLADPPITAIDLRPKEAGASCAELLFELLSGTAEPGTERVHPIALAIRASTTPRP